MSKRKEDPLKVWQKKYPLLVEEDIVCLTSRLPTGRELDLEALVKSSQEKVLCLVLNRDREIAGTHLLEPLIDALMDLQGETSDYEGDWGDYHRIESVVYKGMSWRYATGEGIEYVGNGPEDIRTALPQAFLIMPEVRAKLKLALEMSEADLRSEVKEILSRTRG